MLISNGNLRPVYLRAPDLWLVFGLARLGTIENVLFVLLAINKGLSEQLTVTLAYAASVPLFHWRQWRVVDLGSTFNTSLMLPKIISLLFTLILNKSIAISETDLLDMR